MTYKTVENELMIPNYPISIKISPIVEYTTKMLFSDVFIISMMINPNGLEKIAEDLERINKIHTRYVPDSSGKIHKIYVQFGIINFIYN